MPSQHAVTPLNGLIDTTLFRCSVFFLSKCIKRYCNDMKLGPLSGGWPSGWDVFYGMCDQASTPAGAYYDVTWVDSVAGRTTYTGAEPANYTTSLVGNKTVDFIKQHTRSRSSSSSTGDGNNADKPFMVVAATRAPHKPYLPPPWYEGMFPNIRSPRDIGAWNASTDGNKLPLYKACCFCFCFCFFCSYGCVRVFIRCRFDSSSLFSLSLSLSLSSSSSPSPLLHLHPPFLLPKR